MSVDENTHYLQVGVFVAIMELDSSCLHPRSAVACHRFSA